METLSVLVMLLTMTYACQQYTFSSSTVTMVTRTRHNVIFLGGRGMRSSLCSMNS